MLVEEPRRTGKSTALNVIIERVVGQFIVLVNSDALPERGAISKLLREIVEDRNVGLISASPLVDGKTGIIGAVSELMWGVHITSAYCGLMKTAEIITVVMNSSL